MNELAEQKFLANVELVEYLFKAPNETKIGILDKYDKLAELVLDKTSTSAGLINSNIDCFSVLLNKKVFKTIMAITPAAEKLNYSNLNKLVNNVATVLASKGVNTDKYDATLERLASVIGGTQTIVSTVTPDIVSTALQSFGLETISAEEAKEFDEEPQPEIIDRNSSLWDSIDEINDNDFLSDEGDMEPDWDTDEDASENTDETEDDGISMEDIMHEGDNSNTSEENDFFDDETVDTSKEEEIEKFKQIYSDEDHDTPLSIAIDGILKSFEELYASCYSGITNPDGVLTDKGILSLDKVSGTNQRRFMYNHSSDESSVEYLKNKGKYGQYYKAIMYAIGVVSCGASEINRDMDKTAREACINEAVSLGETVFGRAIDGRKDTTPKWEDCCNTIHFYPRFHTEFMTGNFTISKRMQEWAIENKAKRNATKITRFSDIMKWAKHRVTDCLTEACIEAGVKLEEVGSNDQEITSICQTMSKSIKNIMVITNIKKGYFTLKICSGQPINSQLLKQKILSYFNAMSDGSRTTNINIKNDGSVSGVIEYDIVSDMAEYDKSSSFSADVIDNVIDSGEIPSWSNAILGEYESGGINTKGKASGSTMTFNFKKSCSVSIYGASGSGKGIMTSALLSNAIAEGCEIFYFDGKPDNGAALGKIVWDNNAGDLAVFNGLQGGSNTFPYNLEEYSHGVRSLSLRNGIENIPYIEGNNTWPFNDEKSRKQLYEVSLTLNAFQFVHDAILARTEEKNLEFLPNGDKRWAVFVIDEIQDAAKTENIVRNLMEKYMEVAGEVEIYNTETKTDRKGNTTSQQKKDGKIKDSKNWSKDTGYLFCKQWLAWADSRCVSWESIVTKYLRNSSSTLITIFQSNAWLNQNNGSGKTKIGRLMLDVAQKTTKIVGKGALVSNNKWGDETDYKWTSETDKGKWAIATGEEGLSDNAYIFKPFKVFTTDLGADAAIPVDDRGAGASGCWQSRDNKSGKKPLGLQSYMRYLFSGLQAEMQEQVNNGARLPELMTEYGVLTSSLRYFDNLVKNVSDQSGIMHFMYNVSVISEFNGTASDEQIAQIEHTESVNNSLNDLNSDLNTEEMIDFGGPQQPVSGVASAQPASQNQPQQPMSDFEKQILNQQHRNDIDKNIKFMSTRMLMQQIESGKLNDATIDYYFEKYLTLCWKSKFDLTNRSNSPTGRGLLHLMIIYSNIFILEYMNLIEVYTSLGELIDKAEGDSRQPERSLQIGMYMYAYEAYKNMSLKYDTMPSQEMINTWAQQYIEWRNNYYIGTTGDKQDNSADAFSSFGVGQTSFEDTQNIFGTDTSDEFDVNQGQQNTTDGKQFNPFETNYSGQSARDCDYEAPHQQVSYATGNDGVYKFNQFRSTSDIIQMPADTVVMPKLGFLERIKKKAYESQHGMSYMMSKYWDNVLQLVANAFKGDKLRVTRLAIISPEITANKVVISIDSILGGEDNIELREIINLHKTLKKFPNIQELMLDDEGKSALLDEYGADAQAIWKMFRENPKLQRLTLVTSEGGLQRYDRSNFAATARQLDSELEAEKAKKLLDVAVANKHPRLSSEPGVMYKAHKAMVGNSVDYFKKGHDIMLGNGDKKIRRWLGYTAGGIGAVAIGGILGIPHLLKTRFGKK